MRSFTHSGILPNLQMTPANVVPVASDAEGVEPTALEAILRNWSTSPATSAHPYPKALYTIPTGSNPAGTTASVERKRRILQLCRQYDVLILEDDPYYFLSFEGLGDDPVTRQRPRSYFSLEQEDRETWGDGRVLRYESFSKVSGERVQSRL